MNELTYDTLLHQVKEMLQEQAEFIEQTVKSSVLASNKHMLSLEEAACYLGIAKSTLYKMVQRREIAYHKVSGGDKVVGGVQKKNTGGRLFFKRKDLDEWMEGTRVPSEREMELKALNNHLRKPRK